MGRELEGHKELGKPNIKTSVSIADLYLRLMLISLASVYLEKQLETAPAVSKEDPQLLRLHAQI